MNNDTIVHAKLKQYNFVNFISQLFCKNFKKWEPTILWIHGTKFWRFPVQLNHCVYTCLMYSFVYN